MFATLLEVASYKLTDLLNAAGATIGIIIGGTIFLQFLSSKADQLVTRYRGLTSEYRGQKPEGKRHAPLQSQISLYRRRLLLLIWASWLAGTALLFFLIAVLAGGASMLYPSVEVFKVIGTTGLALGLLLIFGGVALELWESILSRQELNEEVADLDDPVKSAVM